jgi:hypothetical protein
LRRTCWGRGGFMELICGVDVWGGSVLMERE